MSAGTNSGTHSNRICAFQTLAEVLDLVEHAGAAAGIFRGWFACFKHNRASDVSQTTKQDFTFVTGYIDMQQSVHRRGPENCGRSGTIPVSIRRVG
jgi:hypothetical protein